MTKLHPIVVAQTLTILLGVWVDFQPNCDAVIWRIKPARKEEITRDLKVFGPLTIEELCSSNLRPSSAVLATLETMDNVKLINDKLCLI
jgi:hypothetical protein